MNRIPKIFESPHVDLDRMNAVASMAEPRSRYIVAMTPRSGSSYLCDMMTRIGRFGVPSEALNQQFIPSILRRIPGRSADEYLRNFIKANQTRNGVSGLKASWFQFENFIECITDKSYVRSCNFIYLTRQDVYAQAVSLYIATESDVFHTNKRHSDDALGRREALNYDFGKILRWYNHILKQEEGWRAYFAGNSICPLVITYEELEADIVTTMKKIAKHVRVLKKNIVLPDQPSVFQKMRDARSVEWADRFREESRADRPG